MILSHMPNQQHLSTRLGWSREELMKVWDKFKIETTRSFFQKTMPDLSIQSMEEKQGDDHNVVEINGAWIFRLAKSPDVCNIWALKSSFSKYWKIKLRVYSKSHLLFQARLFWISENPWSAACTCNICSSHCS